MHGGRMQSNKMGTQEMSYRYDENISHHKDGQSDQTLEQLA